MLKYGEFRDVAQVEDALRKGRKYIEKVLKDIFPTLSENEVEVHLGWKNSLNWKDLNGVWESMDNISISIHIDAQFEAKPARAVLEGVRKYTTAPLPTSVLENVRDVHAIYSNGSVMVEVEADVEGTDIAKAEEYLYHGLYKMLVQLQNKTEKIVNNYRKV